MPIEAIKIPQNIHIEDRIIGPLSLRQILMMAIGGGVSYVLYSLAAQAGGGKVGVATTVMVCVPALVATLFAIVKINDLSLFRIVLLTLERMNKAPVRTWSPRRGLTVTIHTSHLKDDKDDETAAQKKLREEREAAARLKAKSIGELSTVMDAPLPLPEEEETPPDDPEPAAEPQHTEQDEQPSPRLPVNPDRIDVDGKGHGEDDDSLSAYRGVFRDIEPPSAL